MPGKQSTNPEDTRAARAGEPIEEKKPPRVLLTRELLKAKREAKPTWCAMPELGAGVGVYIKPITAADRTAWEIERTGDESFAELREKLVARFACDEEGHRVFDRGDIPALKNQSAAAISRVADKICELAGWIERDLEDLAGN